MRFVGEISRIVFVVAVVVVAAPPAAACKFRAKFRPVLVRKKNTVRKKVKDETRVRRDRGDTGESRERGEPKERERRERGNCLPLL